MPALAQGPSQLERTGSPEGALVTSVDLTAMLRSGRLQNLDRAVGRLGDNAIRPILDALLAHELSEPGDRRTAIQALRLTRKSVLNEALQGWVSDSNGPEFRLVVLEILAGIGTSKDLDLVLAAATPPRDGPLDSRLGDACAMGVQGCLARDASGFDRLPGRYREVRQELQLAIARGVSEVGGERALVALVAMLGANSQLDAFVLAQIGRVAERQLSPPRPWAAAAVQAYLHKGDPGLRREAVLTLGRLQDASALPVLVEMLERADAPLRAAACWSLRRISGLPFPEDARPWRSWLELEQAWWSAEANHALFCLGSDDSATVLRAIEDIGSHRLNRHELAHELARTPLVGGAEVELAQANALRELGSSSGVVRLLRLLESEHESVQLAAWRGLKEITRKDLPKDPLAWELALR